MVAAGPLSRYRSIDLPVAQEAQSPISKPPKAQKENVVAAPKKEKQSPPPKETVPKDYDTAITWIAAKIAKQTFKTPPDLLWVQTRPSRPVNLRHAEKAATILGIVGMEKESPFLRVRRTFWAAYSWGRWIENQEKKKDGPLAELTCIKIGDALKAELDRLQAESVISANPSKD